MEPITATIAGVTIQLRQLDPACNCWGTKIGNAFLIRHGWIDSSEKAEKLCQALEQFCETSTLRLSSLQLELPESEWDQITAEHILFAWLASQRGLSFQFAHLSLPTQPLYKPKDTPLPSEFLLKAVAKLPKMQDLDGWEVYCYWFHEEMERLLEQFPLESMEIYTLQALLLDFVHEVRATLLQSLEADVTEILLKQGILRALLPGVAESDPMTLEKRLIKRRNEAKEEMLAQHQILDRMIPVIRVIESDHPELQRLKLQSIIVQRLLTAELNGGAFKPLGWVERLLLQQLLNEDLGVITAVSCDTGFDRTSIAFAAQTAILLLLQTVSREKLIDMVLNWQESAELKQFHHLFVEVLKQLCIPMTPSTHDFLWHQSQIESAEILTLFPTGYLRPDKKGLNDAGHRLLVRVCL